MATNNQMQFVSDIEAGVIHLKTEGWSQENPTKIGRVIDASGRSWVELRPIVQSLRKKNEWALLNRLRDAFESVGLIPKAIAEIYAQTELDQKPIKVTEELYQKILEDGWEVVPEEEQQLKLQPVMPIEVEPLPRPMVAESLSHIIKILEPMSHRNRQRIVNSVSSYFEVGE